MTGRLSRRLRSLCLSSAQLAAAIAGAAAPGVLPPLLVAQQQGTPVVIAMRGPSFMSGVGPAAAPIDPAAVPVLRQRVTLPAREVMLGDVLHLLVKQTGVRLQYSRDVVPLNAKLRLGGGRISLAAALTEILLDVDVNVAVTGGDELILVKRPGAARQRGGLVGRVTDTTGRGIVGVEVLLEQTPWRAETDTMGWYRLSGVDSGTYTLMARRLGYAKQSRRVRVRAEREDTVHLVLTPVAVPLNELVTTATGAQRRRDLGNAITTIKADSVLQTAVIRNLTDLLQNRVPGLTVQHTSGVPGDPARLRLRGIHSVLRSNDPVVIVDGMRVYAAQSGEQSGNLTNLRGRRVTENGEDVPAGDLPAPSPLDQIDPNTIEKIEVFKGASAATLYGADAANGVIVITTKRGKPGPARWTANVTHGRTQFPGQYRTGYYRWGHSVHNNVQKFCTLIDPDCVVDSLVQFQALNQPGLTLLGHGQSTDFSLGASGGNEALTYSVTGTYGTRSGYLRLPTFEVDRFRTRFGQEAPDWMREPENYRTWGVYTNVTARLGTHAEVMLTTRLMQSNQRRTSLERSLSSLAATYVDTLNGIYLVPQGSGGIGQADAIFSDYYTKTTASAVAFSTGLSANWHPRSWFDGTAHASVDVRPRDDQQFLPAALLTPTDSGAFTRGVGRELVGSFDVQGTVRKPLGLGFMFQTNVGANLQNQATEYLVAAATRLVPGTVSIVGAQNVTTGESRSSSSVYGWWVEPRVTGQRISLSTGLRLDGGSTYGTRISGLSNLLALPKLNGSWVISEEPWFPFNGLFSSLRLRGAYGQAQVQPGPTDRLRLFSYSEVTSQNVVLASLGNTELRPERSREFEGGFDADLLDNRVKVELTAFHQTQIDALMHMTLPPSLLGGGSQVTRNIGTIRTTGLELSLDLTSVKSSALVWTTSLGYSRRDNTLVELGRGVQPNPRLGLVAGYPVNSRWAKPILGYADQNGDGAIEPSEIQVGDSMVFMGRLQPAYTTSLFTNLALFGGVIDVHAGFSYDAGATQIDGTAAQNWVLARELVDPSTPLAQQAAAVASTNVIRSDLRTDYGVTQTVSTFRFQSLSVNYRAPLQVARLLRAQQLTVAVQGDNLALHTTYKGKDPDVTAWAAGEKILDAGQQPLPRTWQVRIDLRY